ncbi:MAG: hypothetical protein V1694_01010 [Candidatus Eisenbacteria bacterium]
MKTVRLLVLGMFVAAIGAAGLAVAETPPLCNTAGLDDQLAPSGLIYHVGEVIRYQISLKVNPPACDIADATVRFLRPDDPPGDVCEVGHVLAGGLYIPQSPLGFPAIVFDCTTHPAILCYTVRQEDIAADGTVKAYYCIYGTALVGPPNLEIRDEKPSVNFVPTPCINVTKEVCAYSKVGDEVTYTICVSNCGDTDLQNISVIDDKLGNLSGSFPSSLTPGQTECRDITYTVAPGDDPGPIVNTVTAGGFDASGFGVSRTAEATVNLLHPDFTVTKTCLVDPVPPGEDAQFRVTITNTGDVALDFTTDDAAIGSFSLDPRGVFTQDVTRPCAVPQVCNTINVRATIPARYCALPNVLTRSSGEACCQCGGGEATRTPGFWQTHCVYTQTVFDRIGPIDLGWKTLDSYSDVFGMFWASTSRESDRTKRGPICQAQMIGSFQLLAAILNTGLPNGADPGDMIADMRQALADCNRDEILRLSGLLDVFNNSGDEVEIEEVVPPADPKCARDLAGIPFADCGDCD